MSANFTFASAYHDAGAPEPITRPDLFEGVLWRRAMAYLIDACCIGAMMVVLWFFFLLLTVLSFGALGPVLWFLLGLVPLAYHTLLVSGRPLTERLNSGVTLVKIAISSPPMACR